MDCGDIIVTGTPLTVERHVPHFKMLALAADWEVRANALRQIGERRGGRMGEAVIEVGILERAAADLRALAYGKPLPEGGAARGWDRTDDSPSI